MSDKPLSHPRRSFLKGSAITAALIASGTCIWQLSLIDSNSEVEQESHDYQFLTLDDRLLLWAIIPAYLDGALPVEEINLRFELLHSIDSAISLLPQSTQDELRELLDVLTHQLGRAFLANVWTSWNSTGANQVEEFLKRWRESFITLLRAGYLGLHQLIFGSFFAESFAWQAIGYPGPPELLMPESFYQQFD